MKKNINVMGRGRAMSAEERETTLLWTKGLWCYGERNSNAFEKGVVETVMLLRKGLLCYGERAVLQW